VLVCRPTADNKTGNYKISEGLAQRMAERTLGIKSVSALKQAIALSRGSASYRIDYKECKEGETWENKSTGETGVYTKTWDKPVNHEITLSDAAQLEVTKIIFAHELSNSVSMQPQVASVNRNEDKETESNDAPSI
jgi:hypothetical protein